MSAAALIRQLVDAADRGPGLRLVQLEVARVRELLAAHDALLRACGALLTSPATAAEALLERVRQEEREECARVADTEPELSEEPDLAVRLALHERPVAMARACVSVTKSNIANRIRARGQR